MRVDAFHYDLPPEQIAQRPAPDRELARLMHLPRDGGAPEHRLVAEFSDLLPPGALVVVNDTRVIPARLLGRRRETGGRVEVLLVRHAGQREIEVAPGLVRPVEVWSALGKGSKPIKFGADIEVGAPPGRDQDLLIRPLRRTEDDGLLEVALWTKSGGPVDAAVRDCGSVPLPPYIKREAEPQDAERYQTVYARHDGAVAAPTAGLHQRHNRQAGRPRLPDGERHPPRRPRDISPGHRRRSRFASDAHRAVRRLGVDRRCGGGRSLPRRSRRGCRNDDRARARERSRPAARRVRHSDDR